MAVEARLVARVIRRPADWKRSGATALSEGVGLVGEEARAGHPSRWGVEAAKSRRTARTLLGRNDEDVVDATVDVQLRQLELSADLVATRGAADSRRGIALGLTDGERYSMSIFYAHRSGSTPRFGIRTNLNLGAGLLAAQTPVYAGWD